MTTTLAVKVVNWPQLFSSTLWPLPVGILDICIPIQLYGVPLLHYVLVCKIHIHIPPKMRFSSLLLWKSFIYIKLANVWHVILFVQNLIPIWPQSHGLIHQASPLLYLNSISFLATFHHVFQFKRIWHKKTIMHEFKQISHPFSQSLPHMGECTSFS